MNYHREAHPLLAMTPVYVRVICHRNRAMVSGNEVIDSLYLERERSLPNCE